MIHREKIVVINHEDIKFYVLLEIKTDVEARIIIQAAIIDFLKGSIGESVIRRYKPKGDPLPASFIPEAQKEVIDFMIDSIGKISNKEKQRPDVVRIGVRAELPAGMIREALEKEKGEKQNDADSQNNPADNHGN